MIDIAKIIAQMQSVFNKNFIEYTHFIRTIKQHPKMNLESYDVPTLHRYEKGLKLRVAALKEKDVRKKDFLNTVIMQLRMELVKRGEIIRHGNILEHFVLFRWAYLNQQEYPKVRSFLDFCIKEEKEEHFKLLYKLLSESGLTIDEWCTVFEESQKYYSNYRYISDVLYRRQSYFTHCKNEVIPTDPEEGPIVFRQKPTQENAVLFLEAVRVTLKKAIEDAHMHCSAINCPFFLRCYLGDPFVIELNACAQWIQQEYPNEDLLNLIDLCTNPESRWIPVVELSVDAIDNLSTSSSESEIELVI